MPRRVFNSVSVSLLEYAERAANHFENLGYKVLAEPWELGFPYTPTLLARRHGTSLVVEITDKVKLDRIDAWVKYAKSCNHDTRVSVCLPATVEVPPSLVESLRKLRVGVYGIDAAQTVERSAPADLALRLELPPLDDVPKKLKTLLGSAYEQFGRAQWREGFEDACQVFETQARTYLKAGLKSHRIMIAGPNGHVVLSDKAINKMTMGALAARFSQIHGQNRLDARIGQALASVNSDRVGVVHHKFKKITEKRLRANVGQHIWAIVGVLKEMV
jgi:hypothetical protein